MKTEMASIEDFDVKEDKRVDSVPQEDLDEALDLTWVHTWKGFVKSRLCVRGFNQVVHDLDDTYASTPVLYMLRVLLLLALLRGYAIRFFDVSTAFLHATISSDKPIYVWPPIEFYPGGFIIWLLKKAMYGLRSSPRDWQIHFAQALRLLGFVRLQSDANIYVNWELMIYILAYVDDLLIIGPLMVIEEMVIKLAVKLLIKATGNLDEEGSQVRFLGRRLTRRGDKIIFDMDPDYMNVDLDYYGLLKCRPAVSPGSNELKRTVDGDEPLSTHEHKRYRMAVGRLQWLAPLRPDIMYAVKELARALHSPTFEDLAKLKHLLRYFKGTLKYYFVLRVSILVFSDNVIEIDVYVDSDWAGCTKTRKSTTGFIVYLFGSPIHFGSRTQDVPATSSGEAELYAMGTGSNEALHLRSFLLESKITKSVKIKIHTDSSAGKSIACRMGLQKRTRHVQLRFLFIQHLVSNNMISIHKIPGDDNQSDVFTKYVKADVLQRHLEKIGIEYVTEYYNISNIMYIEPNTYNNHSNIHIEYMTKHKPMYTNIIKHTKYYIEYIKHAVVYMFHLVSIMLAAYVNQFEHTYMTDHERAYMVDGTTHMFMVNGTNERVYMFDCMLVNGTMHNLSSLLPGEERASSLLAIEWIDPPSSFDCAMASSIAAP